MDGHQRREEDEEGQEKVKQWLANGEAADLDHGNPVELDDLYQLGKYTYLVCLFAEFTILLQVGNMLFMSYAGAAPTLLGCGGHKFHAWETARERCDRLDQMLNNREFHARSCNSTIELGTQFLSVNMEFGHFCETQMVKSTISYQMLGVIFGTILFGQLSDRWGRKKVMQIALAGCILFMLVTTFTQNLSQFTVARFLANFFNGGTMVVLNVFTSEHYPRANRFCLPNLISWAPNFVLFAILAWLAGDWRTLHRYSAILGLPALGLLHFLNESPRFLLQSNRMEEAKAAILRMHRIDGRPCDEAILEGILKGECHSLGASKKKYNYLHLFHSRRYTAYSLAIAFSFLVYALLDYSLLYNMEKLSGSIYLNAIFMGCSRYSLHLAVAFLELRLARMGRKLVHFSAELLATMALAICAVVYLLDLQLQLPLLPRASTLFVLSFSPVLFIVNSLANNELFPTGVRNTSYSFGQFSCRIGVVLAPQLFFLADSWDWLPYLALMALAMADALIFQFNIDETKGKPMISSFPSKGEEEIAGNKKQKGQGENGHKLLANGANYWREEDPEAG